MNVLLLLITPFLLGFNYSHSLNDWVAFSDQVTSKKISKYKSLESIQTVCDLEQRKELFPQNCLRLIQVIHEIDPKVSLDLEKEALAQQCLEKIHLIETLNQVAWLDRNLKLEGLCKKAFLKRKEIVLYKRKRSM